jgi:hypothetical protein
MRASNRVPRCKRFLNTSPGRAHDGGRGSTEHDPDRGLSFGAACMSAESRVVLAGDSDHRMMGAAGAN